MQPVCENMPGIFLGASICFIKFFQRIERLLKMKDSFAEIAKNSLVEKEEVGIYTACEGID